MPMKTYLNNCEKILIDKMRNEGENAYNISKKIGRHHTTIKKYLDSPTTYGVKIKSTGRPKKTSKRLKNYVLKLGRDGSNSIRDITKIINDEISKSSVGNIMKHSYLNYKSFKKQPPLTKNHKIERVKFAEKIIRQGISYSQRIVFSDEKRFCLDGPDGCLFYWHDSRVKEKFVQRKKFPQSICVWAAIFKDGRKAICFTQENIKSVNYQKILEEHMLPIFEKESDIYQQDNAPAHTSKSTKKFFEDKDITVLLWPANSPDLNIIENIWGIIVQNIYKEIKSFSTINELKNAILKSWELITMDTVNNLYNSFFDRIIKVHSNGGLFLN